MECYIPLDQSIEITNISLIKESHESREFMIFDEDLRLILHSVDFKKTTPHKISVYINDVKVHESSGADSFEDVNKENRIWQLKPSVCSQGIFRSSVVMNNGCNNQITFSIEYTEELQINSNQELPNYQNEDKIDDILPSFEVLSVQPIHIYDKTTKVKNNEEQLTNSEIHSITLKYPIFSFLNMRLRNVLQKSPGYIISSLDFQTSKASTQFCHKFLKSDQKDADFHLNFEEVTYELVDRGAHIKLTPISPFNVPFNAEAHDGYSVSYKLPLPPGGNNVIATNRARITLRYEIISEYLNRSLKIPVITTWQTDVTLKRPMSNSILSQASSNISTPRLYGVSPRANFIGSTTSLVNSKLSNVKFKFTKDKIIAMNGEKFTLTLQIINSSIAPLDMVVYYNNKLPAPIQPVSVSLEKQYQLYKRFHKITEGIILLSNDFKVPVVEPNETYSIDLSFVGIISGYYSTLPGLKMVDLQTNELIEIGMGISVLIN